MRFELVNHGKVLKKKKKVKISIYALLLVVFELKFVTIVIGI